MYVSVVITLFVPTNLVELNTKENHYNLKCIWRRLESEGISKCSYNQKIQSANKLSPKHSDRQCVCGLHPTFTNVCWQKKNKLGEFNFEKAPYLKHTGICINNSAEIIVNSRTCLGWMFNNFVSTYALLFEKFKHNFPPDCFWLLLLRYNGFMEVPLWGIFNNGLMDPSKEFFVQPGPEIEFFRKGNNRTTIAGPHKPDL